MSKNIKYRNISLEEMLRVEVEDILTGYPNGPTTYYWMAGDGKLHEIVTLDLFRGRLTTDDNDFSEFEWEMKESRIYVKES